ncbi:molybdopterin molybdotransferase MoeA [Propylenella binzhouense]|uniref:Molybdopterin molybdenumtransferase n=1 Tax=Propylenella binzhouense TaxID=2555902 RepID=A0A964T4D8_9HYPH|nr:gephyrin-like molybdotransferase Glp [Propylenella binzhouense]MYZ47717.1 molybdopterin molybdotransferase MoeA [Propylenella binzhouense]
MSLVPVKDALARLLSGVDPLAAEMLPLAAAAGRVLASDVAAARTQPPFPASAMDGYAVRAADVAIDVPLAVVGASRAGERFRGTLGPGEAVRIFTGAPVPPGADAILIQEDAVADGDRILPKETVSPGQFVRPAGLDFTEGQVLLHAGRLLDPRAIALAAAMNRPTVAVRRRPVVAILGTGDELVPLGSAPGPDQIVSSNNLGLAALVREAGGEPVDLGIAADTIESIADAVDRATGADILVITGGASVGEHDLVQPALVGRGMALDFWKIAMRPGKPLMVGRLQGMRVLGLPGNPVSTLVCGHIFLKPLIAAMLGTAFDTEPETAVLGADMKANDRRQDYVRARVERRDGKHVATPYSRQDSSMLATLAAANGLIVRPPFAPAIEAGSDVPVLLLGS